MKDERVIKLPPGWNEPASLQLTQKEVLRLKSWCTTLEWLDGKEWKFHVS